MTCEVIPIRAPKNIVVSYDDEGWHVQMGALHKVFWKQHHAAGFIDLLLARNVATVTVKGELPEHG